MTSILLAGRNFWCERPVASAGLLVDADDYYRAFYDAAQKAEHYILLAGWQFDSDACLLRGGDAEDARLPVTLLRFLNALCARNPDLRIYILAWDFHAVFALEREWMQEIVFNWMTSKRLQFRFDGSHVDKGAHHQKFVVIDGELAFLGGLDLCDHRWDGRVPSLPHREGARGAGDDRSAAAALRSRGGRRQRSRGPHLRGQAGRALHAASVVTAGVSSREIRATAPARDPRLPPGPRTQTPRG